ncbi:MAG: KpsF/GutQ family sugar-phosphate isomerase [Gemmatimonadaceae bacterium]|nr:KpsF/GutQ family sugar-phosphate isomerase [Gemmatimonadaceae bacterium]
MSTSVSVEPALDIIARGRRVLELERDALTAAAATLGSDFERAVQLIAQSSGRVIVAGVGKSGLIGRKIAATLTSTGTPAMFLHPVESVHGDLGIVGPGDVAILLSKSGETTELLGLIDALARLGVRMIAMTADRASRLARHADVVLDLGTRDEACPHDLAPTTSTTVTLALGDALAVALLQERGFRAEDFARLHPGGALGRKLLTRVRDVMEGAPLPTVPDSATMRDATVRLAGRRGIAIVIDESSRMCGVVTAGDLARLLEREPDALGVPVTGVMTTNPRVARDDELGSAVVHRMETHGIMAMPVLDAHDALVGVVHLHDLMRAGAV